jgi:hypothetical protein
MVASICRPRWIVGINLLPQEILNTERQRKWRNIRTLVGVLGQVVLISFLLGRCPRERVTLEGAPDAEDGGMVMVRCCYAANRLALPSGVGGGDTAINRSRRVLFMR